MAANGPAGPEGTVAPTFTPGPSGIISQYNAAGSGPAGPAGAVSSPLSSSTGAFKFTEGWYLFAGIAVAIGLSNVPAVAPFAAGILTLGLIYQTSMLLEGK